MRKNDGDLDIRIISTESFKKAYLELPEEIQRKFKRKLEFFVQDPAHPSLNLHRINDYWEFYIDTSFSGHCKK